MANEQGGQDTPKPAAVTPPAGKDGAAPAATPAPAGKDGGEAQAKAAPTGAAADAGKGGAPATESGGKDGGQPAKPEAPATYELTVPEGADVFVNEGTIAKITAAAKANGWTNEQAQAALEQITDEAVEQAEAFRTETVNDPVYGGEHLEATQQNAERAIDAMWPKGSKDAKAFRSLLTSSGYGNNRLILGGLANIGKLMAEDNPERGKPSAGATKPAAEVLYGKS